MRIRLCYNLLTSPIECIFMILQENASCIRQGALFYSFALSVWGRKFTSRGILGAPFADLASHFSDKNIVPRLRRKHNFNFRALKSQKIAFLFSYFSVFENYAWRRTDDQLVIHASR